MRKKILVCFTIAIMWGFCVYFYFFFLMVYSTPVPYLDLTNALAFQKRIQELGQVFPSKGSPWPRPQKMSTHKEMVYIDPERFSFTVPKHSCDILEKALQRYRPPEAYTGRNSGLRRDMASTKPQLLKSVTILLNNPCERWPHLGMDESYAITFHKNSSALLSSGSIWGILRGLETFTHLFWMNDHGQLVANSTTIKDEPRFSHRGILLDTSRHYLHVSTIKQNLDLMAMNKMNVFHWHMVDDNSFPYQSKRFPNLSNYGAYNNESVYTPEDVQDIIEHARLRGVRVIPEFDTPGHSLSWGLGHPELLTECYDINGKVLPGQFGPMDPSKDSTFKFLQDFFEEIATVFPEKCVHIGGDEVETTCWMSNPKTKELMSLRIEPGKYKMKDLQDYFMKTLIDIIKGIDKSKDMIVWEESFDHSIDLPPETIVHVWKPHVPYQSTLKKVTLRNLRVILSSCWYLNYIKYGNDWDRYYTCDPLDGLPADKRHLILGGEAAMWGEFVDDSNLISRLWPRASAVAEQLWSGAAPTSMKEVEKRMEEHTCRLRRRGYNVQPITGPGFCP